MNTVKISKFSYVSASILLIMSNRHFCFIWLFSYVYFQIFICLAGIWYLDAEIILYWVCIAYIPGNHHWVEHAIYWHHKNNTSNLPKWRTSAAGTSRRDYLKHYIRGFVMKSQKSPMKWIETRGGPPDRWELEVIYMQGPNEYLTNLLPVLLWSALKTLVPGTGSWYS